MPDGAFEVDALTHQIGELIDLLTMTRETLAEELACSSATVYSWSVGRRTPRPPGREALVAAARKRALELVACADRIEDLSAEPVAREHLFATAERLRREHRSLREKLRQLRLHAERARRQTAGLVANRS